jgi:hypothetical protein
MEDILGFYSALSPIFDEEPDPPVFNQALEVFNWLSPFGVRPTN